MTPPPLIDDLPISYPARQCTDTINESAFTSLYVPIVLLLNGIDSFLWCKENPNNTLSRIILCYTKALSRTQKRLLHVLQAWIIKRVCDTNCYDISLDSISQNIESDNSVLGCSVQYYVRRPGCHMLQSSFEKNGLLKTKYIDLIMSSTTHRLRKMSKNPKVNDEIIGIVLNGYLKYPLYEYILSIAEWFESGICS